MGPSSCMELLGLVCAGAGWAGPASLQTDGPVDCG